MKDALIGDEQAEIVRGITDAVMAEVRRDLALLFAKGGAVPGAPDLPAVQELATQLLALTDRLTVLEAASVALRERMTAAESAGSNTSASGAPVTIAATRP
jgi:hypothetical protein